MFVHCVQVGKMKTDLVGGIINLTFPPLCQGNESLSLSVAPFITGMQRHRKS